MTTIDLNAAELALDRSEGFAFERFAQAFMSGSMGRDFISLGGVHDGGADGYVSDDGKSTEHFMQASIEKDHRSKIRKTVRRLIAAGRKPKRLTYLTNQVVSLIDQEEERLSEELGVTLRIRDQKYIRDHINDSAQTIEAFNSHLAQFLAFLQRIGSSTLVAANRQGSSRALCVFLGQEAERRHGKTSLLQSVVDSLILWALEDTDPDKGILFSRDEVLSKIEDALPSARAYIRGELDKRLEILSSKSNPTGREINWHRKDDRFCLPYATRLLIREENLEDETLRLRVSDIFERRAKSFDGSASQGFAETVADTCHKTLDLTFLNHGYELSSFVQGVDQGEVVPSVQDNLRTIISQSGIGPTDAPLVEEMALRVLRATFYASETQEREYLGKLCRTYFLLFTLQNEPRIVEYFQSMAFNLILYVGADLLVRALSERYLAPENAPMRSCFKVLAASGAKLILTEKAVEEVLTHLRAQDFEYRNHYAAIEQYMTLDLASQIDRLLLRAYFYARLDPDNANSRPSGWASFMEQFCSYTDLHQTAGGRSLMRSLSEEFELDYETSAELERSVDPEQAEELAQQLATMRANKDGSELLAYNDALQVLRVYARRIEGKEDGRGNRFGYRTWWLTKEVAVLRAAASVIAKAGSPFWMRPEFILNFIALSPSKQDVAESYKTIFPSILGLRLSNRLKADVVQDYAKRIADAAKLSEPRARAAVAEWSDRLKSDRLKIYQHNLG